MTTPLQHVNARIHQAAVAVEAAIPSAERDPQRPVFHFRPPAQWMNDPNGTIFHQGYYHLFYQHNPYAATWGRLHWGHARSRDLVYWEHLPIALWPSEERQEEHCFSGCAYLDDQAGPLLFYTSIGHALPEQWAAVGDADLIAWNKHAANPILTMAAHQGVEVQEWRDPFIFQAAGRTFMVLGGKIAADAVALIYEKGANALTWTYQGILFRHPDASLRSLECPNFFRLQDRWALLDSPYGPVEYFVGTFDLDTLTFTPETQGKVDWSSQFYATNLWRDDQGQTIMAGWIRGFEQPQGWNGCLSLPRVLSIGDDGRLRQQPVPELRKLRGRHAQIAPCELCHASQCLPDVNVAQCEILAQFELQGARECGLKIDLQPDHRSGLVIRYDGAMLRIGESHIPLSLMEKTDMLTLRIFIDRSVLEVFVNDGQWCFTQVIAAPIAGRGVDVFAQDGPAALKQCDIWEMQAIW